MTLPSSQAIEAKGMFTIWHTIRILWWLGEADVAASAVYFGLRI
jgi:hypothetical protein